MTASSLNQTVHARLSAMIAADGDGSQEQLNDAFRLLAKWRSVLVQNTLLAQGGTQIMHGPFAGMDFIRQSTEGCHVAKLLGCYEQPLHPFIERAMATGYATVANIGCAEGYYAIGMARRMPQARILAHDTDARALETCRELAGRNGVADRVSIGGLFAPEDFARLGAGRVLVLCDIEGGEQALLDPQLAPALRGMDLIVESHECLVPGITRLLAERFRETHEITLVEDDGQRQLGPMPAWFNSLAHLDQLVAVWEWRSGPTPWLVMTARQPAT